jgi:hypothetical protein
MLPKLNFDLNEKQTKSDLVVSTDYKNTKTIENFGQARKSLITSTGRLMQKVPFRRRTEREPENIKLPIKLCFY